MLFFLKCDALNNESDVKMVLRKNKKSWREGKFGDVTLLKVKNEMEERHNMILERNKSSV